MANNHGKCGRWRWYLKGELGHPVLAGETDEGRYSDASEIHVIDGEVYLDDKTGEFNPEDGEYGETHTVATQMKVDLQAAVAFCAARAGASDLDNLMVATSHLWDAMQAARS